jgi:hypothetical protein
MDYQTIDLGKGYTAEVQADITAAQLRRINAVVGECVTYEDKNNADGSFAKRTAVMAADYQDRYQDRLITETVKSISKDGKPMEGTAVECFLSLPASCATELDAAVCALMPKKRDPK